MKQVLQIGPVSNPLSCQLLKWGIVDLFTTHIKLMKRFPLVSDELLDALRI